MRKTGFQYIIIFLGAILYAFSVAVILEPNRLAPGGASGLAIIINSYTGIKTGTIIFVLNIPLMIMGIKNFGIKFLYTTIFAIFVNSIFINIFEFIPKPVDDIFLGAVCGGVLDAVSLGIIFRQGGTSGGTDIVAKLVKKKIPHFEIGKIFIAVDMAVVLLSAFAFKNIENAVYSAICVVITGQILDRILYGGQNARMLYIISDCSKEISERLLKELDTGVTYLKGTGGYTSREKNVIMCIIRKRRLPQTLKVIKEEDDSAFIIVTLADKVVGEGYREDDND